MFILFELYLTKIYVRFYLRPSETGGIICSSRNFLILYLTPNILHFFKKKIYALTCKLESTLWTPERMFQLMSIYIDLAHQKDTSPIYLNRFIFVPWCVFLSHFVNMVQYKFAWRCMRIEKVRGYVGCALSLPKDDSAPLIGWLGFGGLVIGVRFEGPSV